MPLTRHRVAQQGFSMVVIAGLFAAFAIVAASAIDRSNVRQQTMRQSDASAQLRRINLALTAFALYNGNRYPCPAAYNLTTGDANYGVPVANCESSATGLDVLKLRDNSTNSSIIRGIVPFTALASFGVNPGDAIDPWGSRIMYIVHRQLTPAGSGSATSGNGNAATDRAVVQTESGALAYNPPDFVVLSYGRDRIGAIAPGATSAAIGCSAIAAVLREQNCDNNLLFTQRAVNAASNATVSNYFDDLLSFYALQ